MARRSERSTSLGHISPPAGRHHPRQEDLRQSFLIMTEFEGPTTGDCTAVSRMSNTTCAGTGRTSPSASASRKRKLVLTQPCVQPQSTSTVRPSQHRLSGTSRHGIRAGANNADCLLQVPQDGEAYDNYACNDPVNDKGLQRVGLQVPNEPGDGGVAHNR